MDRRSLLTAPLAALPAWAAATEPALDTLVLVNSVYPPFVNPAGHPRGEGIDIEIAREALRRGGAGRYRIEVQLLPWKRALYLLEKGLADFTTTAARNPERDRFLDWTVPYRTKVIYRFYSRKEAEVNVRRIDDLARYRLGLSAGFIYPPPVLQQVGENIEQAKDIATAIKMVLTGRVELVVISNYAGIWEIRELGLADQLQMQPFEFPSEVSASMGFSRARPNPQALAAMKSGLASMLQDGSVARIERKYLAAP
jgi:ABC-type amino acid transport substrate-binding protein